MAAFGSRGAAVVVSGELITRTSPGLSGNQRPGLGYGGCFAGLGIISRPIMGAPINTDQRASLRNILLVGPAVNR